MDQGADLSDRMFKRGFGRANRDYANMPVIAEMDRDYPS